jgi:double-stranded uracil-DNA glycosylase
LAVGPGRAELEAAAGRTVDDVVSFGLRILFCGINPGLWSAAEGAHFARPGNRFWKALHGCGLTDRLLRPDEQRQLLTFGIGITNLVERATTGADELSAGELRLGARRLEAKVDSLRPRVVAFLGMGAYRAAFSRPGAAVGRQDERLAGSVVWLLPNPSGLQARYQLPELVVLFSELRVAAQSAVG